jgi:REP element-mobilizing transposase RayT
VRIQREDDRVHLLVEYLPKTAVSAVVNSLKGVSPRAATNLSDWVILTNYLTVCDSKIDTLIVLRNTRPATEGSQWPLR